MKESWPCSYIYGDGPPEGSMDFPAAAGGKTPLARSPEGNARGPTKRGITTTHSQVSPDGFPDLSPLRQ